MKAKILTTTILMCMLMLPFDGFSQLLQAQDLTNGTDVTGKSQLAGPKGVVFENTVACTGLMNNILGDSPERTVSVYLPPDYFINQQKRYPVIYMLGGYSAEHDYWFGGCDPTFNLNETMDNLIMMKIINPAIVVSPSNCNKYMGSWFTDSRLSGNWESFNAVDLVRFIDENYRTLAQAESRGIAGCSMGGFGAVTLAMKYPETFSCVYSIDGEMLDFTESILNNTKTKSEYINAAKLKSSIFTMDTEYLHCFSAAIAFAPNENSVGFGELPFRGNGELKNDVWQKWLTHDPVSLVPVFKENLKKLTGIVLEYGEPEIPIKSGNMSFSEILNDNGIPHTVNNYELVKSFSLNQRMENHMLPFFSANLKSTQLTTGNKDLNTAEFSVYPNPATDKITIQTYGNRKYLVELTSATGALIYQFNMERNLHELNISMLSKGIYVVKLKSKGIISTRKITKM